MSVDKKRYGSTLYKLARLTKDILPKYNKHIYNIITNFDEEAKYADKALMLGGEDIDDVINDVENLLSLHRDNNHNNVHGETKSTVGLGILENLRLANEEEAILGATNDRYMTPYMAGRSVYVNAAGPLNSHINNKNHPHNETAAQIGSMSRAEIDSLSESKYRNNETVVGSDHATLGTKKTFATLLSEFRTNLPPGNFDRGLINPRRVANGTPSANTVALSDNRTWTAISTLASDPQYSGRVIAAATFNNSYTVSTALNFLRNNAPYNSLPDGSIVLFTVVERLGSVTHTYNNGSSGTSYWNVGVGHVAVKYSASNWQVL